MKLIPNIPGYIKLWRCLKYFNEGKEEIEAAKTAGDRETERKVILRCTSTWANMMMKYFNCKLEIEGEENIPDKGPVVIMCDHQGYADILALFAAFQKFQFGFIAKIGLGKIPFYGKWIVRIRSVLIQRDDARASLEAIKEGVELLKEGYSLVIFPEGTRAKCSTPGPFLKGAIKLATTPGVPIVPVSIDGTYRMYEETGVFTPTTFRMIIHKPITKTAGLSRKEERQLGAEVEKIIVDGVHRLAAEGNSDAGAENLSLNDSLSSDNSSKAH